MASALDWRMQAQPLCTRRRVSGKEVSSAPVRIQQNRAIRDSNPISRLQRQAIQPINYPNEYRLPGNGCARQSMRCSAIPAFRRGCNSKMSLTSIFKLLCEKP